MAKCYEKFERKNQAKPNAILENIAELYAASTPTLDKVELISEQKSIMTMSRFAIKIMESVSG